MLRQQRRKISASNKGNKSERLIEKPVEKDPESGSHRFVQEPKSRAES